MKVERRTVGTVNVCAPLDALVEDLSEEFNNVLRESYNGAHPRVVIDMTDVSYMDSVALEGFLDVSDSVNERGLQLKLAGVTPTCRETFEITGIGSRFLFFEDVEAAVRSFL
jgi:anti-sigma B factor antagonist